MIDYFVIDDFFCAVADIVHLPHPLHLIRCFELFGHAFLFGKLFHQSVEHLSRFFVNICEIGGEPTTRQKIGIADRMMVFEIPQMPFAPYTDFDLWLFG